MSKLMTIPVISHEHQVMIDITAEIDGVIHQSGIKEGIACLQVMHTTAAITINENADPDVLHDMLWQFNKMVPKQGEFRHSEGNSDAHVKSTLVGPTLTIHVNQGKMVLGTWQGIYFCEFDGPRQRKVVIRVIGQEEDL